MDGWIQKRAAGRVGWIDPGSPFFEKSGRPAGQPTMYLDPPIHFGSIFIGIGILLDVFSSICFLFSLRQVTQIQERVFFENKPPEGCAATATCACVQSQIPHPK